MNLIQSLNAELRLARLSQELEEIGDLNEQKTN